MLIPNKHNGYSKDGIRLYHMDSGGGSSNTGSSTQIQELPEWARGYAKSALEKGAALSEKPYQKYEGDRIAGFSPMQLKAQQDAANMTTNAATGRGIDIAGNAAQRALDTKYDAGTFQGGQFDSGAAQQYMSPYMQNVVDIQKREARRQADIGAQQQQAGAAGRGAFGGSRDALMRAERERNLGTQMGDIQATGSQNAYQAAMQQFNADQARRMQAEQLGEQSRQFGANIGLQGLNTALQGAGQLGALGGQQFQQGMDINKLQNAYGGQQQALRQQGLSQAYEDFQNEQNYPYKQLGFFSDMIRGLPLGQMTTRSMYEPNPSFAQQAGATGMGLYGLSKFMAEGGMAYADGGSVDSPDNVERIVSRLSDQQLQQAAQAAQARGDMDQLEAIQSEMAMRASERRGVAAGITPQMADRMAGGGIVAFDEGGVIETPMVVSEGNKGHYDTAGKMALAALEELRNYPEFKALEPEKRAELEQATFKRIMSFGGEDPYAPMAKRIAGLEAAGAKNYERGLGAAAFKAIPAILKGGNAIRGIGGGLGAFGEEAEKADRAKAANELALASAGFNLSDAQRKERIAVGREALGNVKDTEAARLAAYTTGRKELTDRAGGAAKVAQAFRPVGTRGGAGGAGRGPKLAEQLAAAEIAFEKDPSDANKQTVTALRRAMSQSKTTDVGATKADLTREGRISNENAKVQAAMKSFKYDPAYMEAKQAGPDEAERVWNEELARQRQFYGTENPQLKNPKPSNNTPPPPPGFTPN
jgi:hypothetical protein